MKLLKNAGLTTAFFAAVSAGIAQTPTGIDPGFNDEEVIMWNDPIYILIAIVILLAIVLGWLRFMGKKRRSKPRE